MSECFTHTLRNEVGELATCLQALEASETYQEMPPPLRFVSELVLDELVSNTIKHGGPGSHRISTSVEWNGDHLTICVEDDGLPFNPWARGGDGPLEEDETQHATAQIQTLKVGGRGLQMLHRATDTRQYKRIAGKNIVTVTASA